VGLDLGHFGLLKVSSFAAGQPLEATAREGGFDSRKARQKASTAKPWARPVFNEWRGDLMD
jgi:hypothetical protein